MDLLLVAVKLDGALRKKYWSILLGEDYRNRSGGPKIIMAKHDLQELENSINEASFFLAETGNHSAEALRSMMSEAQKSAFCLEDQIDMYAMHGLRETQLYLMKKVIGMFSIDKLTEIIKCPTTNIREAMQSPELMAQLPVYLPFILSCQPHHSPEDTEIFGMDAESEALKRRLLDPAAEAVIFVSGGQLSGKTTLMNKVYEDPAVKNYFHVRSKVDIAQTRSLVDLLRAVLKHDGIEANSVDPDAIDEFKIMDEIVRIFGIEGNNYLIVLDDVQDMSALQSLQHILGNYNGKIVCLTRSKDMIPQGHAPVEVLPLGWTDQCRLLLYVACRNTPAVANTSGLQGDGLLRALLQMQCRHEILPTDESELDKMVRTLSDILEKCRGNPWSIRAAGALLHACPVEKWMEVRQQVDAVVIGDERRDPLIQLEDAKLPSEIRRAFLYCLAFPERSELPETSAIPARKLIRLWMAEGFIDNNPHKSQEQEAEDLLHKLIDKKLLVVKKKGFDGDVLKCGVNEHIRSMALQMCQSQKFCRFVPRATPQAMLQPRPSRSTGFSLRSWSFPFTKGRKLSHRYRMLAVHGDGGLEEATKALSKDIRLRSLLYSRTGKRREHPKLELSLGRTYKLLRTLELEGTHLSSLPGSIGTLVCLRYLGLRRTQLEYLPSFLRRLRLLMCLDIRDTNIAEVTDVSAFTEMRHIYLANSFRDQSVLIREGLPSLLQLQTLSGAAHGLSSDRQMFGMIPFEQELLYLKLLRKLSIKKVSSASCNQICAAINKMDFLQSLTITCGEEQFNISSLKIKNNLRKLKLGGVMDHFYELQPRMQSITYLYLWDSNLPDDPLQRLQDLQHLLLLSLYNSFAGDKMSCGDCCYHKLKKLSIISMETLEDCTFGIGAMRDLEELVFAKCGKLSSPPPVLDLLDTLREVHLAQMPEEFCKKVNDCLEGNDHVRVLESMMHFHTSGRAATQGN